MSNFSTAAMPSFLNTRPARHDFVHGLAGAGLGLSVLHLVDGGEANIDAAATGATIAICPGAYVENLTIAKDIRPANVVLQNLRITIGRNARLQLTNSEIRGNAADNDGGIDVHDGADVRFDAASRVTENRAKMAGGGAFVSTTAGRVSLVNTANINGNTPTDCGGTAVDLCSDTAGPR